MRAYLAGAAAVGTPLGGNLSAAKTLRTGTLHRESALTERDGSATAAFGADLLLGAGCAATAVAHLTLLVDLELDIDLAAQHRGAERHLERRLHVLATLGTARAPARVAAEHRAEDVTQSAESTDVD